MQKSHISAINELEKLCFGWHWTPTNFERELENTSCHYFVSVLGQRPVGYIGYWQILEEAHITSVGVHPDFRKRRLAQWMLAHMLDDCLNTGAHWITLEVKANNEGAKQLYQKFGFGVLGTRRNYYQAEKQDALVMWTENISTPEYQALLQGLKQELNDLQPI